MKKILIAIVIVLSFCLTSCANTNITGITGISTIEKKNQTTTKTESPKTTTTKVEKPLLGSKELPLTAGEAIGYTLSEMNSGAYSDSKGFVTGIIKSLEYNSKYSSYTLKIVTNASSTSEFTVFSGTLAKTIKSIHIGDTIVATGYYYNYNGESAEMTGSSDPKLDYPEIISVEHVNRTITIGSHDNAEVTELSATEVLCGTEITFKVTANTGYEVNSVKVNGAKIFDNNGLYTVTIETDSEIVVKAVLEGTITTIGTLDKPKSVIEAKELIDELNGSYSEDKAYVKGVVTSVTYDSTYGSYNLMICDENDTTKLMQIYGGMLAESITEPHVGDAVIGFGYLYLYVGYNSKSYEMTGESDLNIEYPNVVSVSHKERTVTVEISNGTVEGLLDKYECGSTASFTINVNDKCELYSVSVNGNVITGNGGTYSFVVKDDTTVNVKILAEGEEKPVETTITKTVAELAQENSWTSTKKYTKVNLDDIVTIEYLVGTSYTGGYYAATKSAEASWRVYSSDKGEIKITVEDGYELTGFSYKITSEKGELKNYSPNTLHKISGTSITIPTAAKCYICEFTVTYIKTSK